MSFDQSIDRSKSRIFVGEVVVAMGLFAWSSVPGIPLFFTAIFLLLGFYMIASGLFKR